MITSGKYGLFISVLKFVFRQLLKDKKFSGCFILKEVIFFYSCHFNISNLPSLS